MNKHSIVLRFIKKENKMNKKSRCVQCNEQVPSSREPPGWATPICFECLPPPEPLKEIDPNDH